MNATTETQITLHLSEYEASVITGALVEHAERWASDYPGQAETATGLRDAIREQLPAAWH